MESRKKQNKIFNGVRKIFDNVDSQFRETIFQGQEQNTNTFRQRKTEKSSLKESLKNILQINRLRWKF